MVRQGYAPGGGDRRGAPPRTLSASGTEGGGDLFWAIPSDTRGEAEYGGALAARRHWRRLIVVPERSQATRARMLFERCTSARLIVVPVADPPSSLFVAIPYEWGALVKALIVRGC